MHQNKKQMLENPYEFNIFRNDRPLRWQKRTRQQSTDIITHLSHHRNHSTILPNPEKHIAHLSYSKTVPLNTEIIRQRSQMIAHPSKISRDVPSWFKGDTYKYYSRNQYNNLYKPNDLYTIDPSPRGQMQRMYQNRSEASTPRSRQSDRSDNFYMGDGGQSPTVRRPYIKKVQKQLAPKIGSVQHRDFRLPRVQLKIGHQEEMIM